MKNQSNGYWWALAGVLAVAGCGHEREAEPARPEPPVPTTRTFGVSVPLPDAATLLSEARPRPVVRTNVTTAAFRLPEVPTATTGTADRSTRKVYYRFVAPDRMISRAEESDRPQSVNRPKTVVSPDPSTVEGLSRMVAISYVRGDRMLSRADALPSRAATAIAPDEDASAEASGPGFIEYGDPAMDEGVLNAADLFASPTTDRESVQKAIFHVREAERMFDARRYDAAAGEYASALLLFPEVAYVNRQLGRISLLQGKYSAAISFFTAALDSEEYLAETLNDLGIAYLYSGDYERAVSSFTSSLQADENIYEPMYNMALALRRMGRIEEARSRVNEYLLYEHSDARGYRELGVLAYLDGDADRAMELFREAVRLDERWSVPYLDLAELYMEEGNHVEALAMLTGALSTPVSAASLFRFYRRPMFDEARLQPESQAFEAKLAAKLKGRL